MVAKELCKICSTSQARYKCPTCSTQYCSLNCYKKHKESPCVPPKPKTLPPYHPKPQKKKNDRERNMMPEDDEILLTNEQLTAIDNHHEVQRKFRDSRIKKIMHSIDSSKDRSKKLEQEMQNGEFLEFCDDILEAIGIKNPDEKEISLQQLIEEELEKNKIKYL